MNVLTHLKDKVTIYLNANVWPWKIISDLKADVDDARNNEKDAKQDMYAAFNIIGQSVSWNFYGLDERQIDRGIVIHSGLHQSTHIQRDYGYTPNINDKLMEVKTHTLIPHVETYRFHVGYSRDMSYASRGELRNCLVSAAEHSLYKHVQNVVDDMMEGKYDDTNRKDSYPF